jgi:putative membrane protein
MKIKNWIISLLLSCVIAFVAHAQSKLTDAQIIEIVEQGNEAEISVAEMAESKAKNPEVKKLALEVILLHEKTNREIQRIAKENNINPIPSKTSNTIRTKGKAFKKEFKQKKPLDFDRMFVDQQAVVYQKFVTEMDQKLIPFAQKKELKDFLMSTRNEVADHLIKVKSVQASF